MRKLLWLALLATMTGCMSDYGAAGSVSNLDLGSAGQAGGTYSREIEVGGPKPIFVWVRANWPVRIRISGRDLLPGEPTSTTAEHWKKVFPAGARHRVLVEFESTSFQGAHVQMAVGTELARDPFVKK